MNATPSRTIAAQGERSAHLDKLGNSLTDCNAILKILIASMENNGVARNDIDVFQSIITLKVIADKMAEAVNSFDDLAQLPRMVGEE